MKFVEVWDIKISALVYFKNANFDQSNKNNKSTHRLIILEEKIQMSEREFLSLRCIDEKLYYYTWLPKNNKNYVPMFLRISHLKVPKSLSRLEFCAINRQYY